MYKGIDSNEEYRLEMLKERGMENSNKGSIRSMESIFDEPVCVGTCPLCGSKIYSENDPGRDPMAKRVCCNCEWEDNQFMTREEMRGY